MTDNIIKQIFNTQDKIKLDMLMSEEKKAVDSDPVKKRTIAYYLIKEISDKLVQDSCLTVLIIVGLFTVQMNKLFGSGLVMTAIVFLIWRILTVAKYKRYLTTKYFTDKVESCNKTQ